MFPPQRHCARKELTKEEKEHNTPKSLLAEELDISGIDDPEKMREIVKQMKRTDVFSSVLGHLIFAAIGWFIWKPISVVLVIFCVAGQLRRSIQQTLFWDSRAPFILGILYGAFLTGAVKIGVITSNRGLTITIFFYLFGFLAASYISYSTRTDRFQTRSDELRIMTMACSVTTYLVACIAPFFIPFLVNLFR
jgi:uncharacterized integral membrane protein